MSRLIEIELTRCDWRDDIETGPRCRNDADYELHCHDGWIGSYCAGHSEQAQERHDRHCIERVSRPRQGTSE